LVLGLRVAVVEVKLKRWCQLKIQQTLTLHHAYQRRYIFLVTPRVHKKDP
jgi:hypothetical protein